MVGRLTVADIKKGAHYVPPEIERLIGDEKAYIVTGRATRGGVHPSGYYMTRQGHIRHGNIPDYAWNGNTWLNLTGRLSRKDREAMEREHKQKQSEFEQSRADAKAKGKKDLRDTAKRISEAEYTRDTDEKDAVKELMGKTQAQVGEAFEQFDDVSETGKAPRMYSEHLKAEEKAKAEEAEAEAKAKLEADKAEAREFLSTLEMKRDGPEINLKSLPEQKKFLSWKGMSDEFKKWAGFLQNIYAHFMTMAQTGTSTYASKVVGVTMAPMMNRAFDANRRIEGMFKSAGVDNIDKWLDDHDGTARRRFLEKKVLESTKGMSEGFEQAKKAVVKSSVDWMVANGVNEKGEPKNWTKEEIQRYTRGAMNGTVTGWMEGMTYLPEDATDEQVKAWKENRASLKATLGKNARSAYALAKQDPSNVKAVQKYLMAYDMYQGFVEGGETAKMLVENKSVRNVTYANLLARGYSNEEAWAYIDRNMNVMVKMGVIAEVPKETSDRKRTAKPSRNRRLSTSDLESPRVKTQVVESGAPGGTPRKTPKRNPRKTPVASASA